MSRRVQPAGLPTPFDVGDCNEDRRRCGKPRGSGLNGFSEPAIYTQTPIPEDLNELLGYTSCPDGSRPSKCLDVLYELDNMRNEAATDLRPHLLAIGEDVIGPTSNPVHGAITWLVRFFSSEPVPDLGTEDVRSPAGGLATHLIHLLRACGLLNLTGHHSAAATLLRPLEDALDCFAAVLIVPGAAAKWSAGQLRASDAAKLWTPMVREMVARGMSLAEYRRRLREKFNDYAHCSPELCAWNLFFLPNRRDAGTGEVIGSLELNHAPNVIEANAHAIDAHCVGHLSEFMVVIRLGYSRFYEGHPEALAEARGFEKKLWKIMEKHDRHGCQRLSPPPEIRKTMSSDSR